MSISTVEKPEDKREKLRLLREFHKTTFDALGVHEPLFIPKLAYKPPGWAEKAIAFFASEIGRGMDIYVEFTESDYSPMDPDRRLYKWRYNPNYKEEYEIQETNTSIRYFIPVSELLLIKSNSADILVEEHAKGSIELKADVSLISDEDVKLTDATIRDLAAVLLKKPISRKNWLNDLINKSV